MNCEKARELLENGILEPSFSGSSENKKSVSDHVRTCHRCEEYLEDLHLVNASFDMLEAPEPPADLVSSIIASLPDNPARAAKQPASTRPLRWKERFGSWLQGLVPGVPRTALATALCLIAVLVTTGVLFISPDEHTPPVIAPVDPGVQPPSVQVIAWRLNGKRPVSVGETVSTSNRQTMELTGGNHRILIRPNSSVTVAGRAVELKRGEILASFDRLDAPFSFTARGNTIQILGTILGIRTIPGQGIEVAVLEGKVKVTSASGQEVILQSYQQARVSNGQDIERELLPYQQDLLWKNGHGGTAGRGGAPVRTPPRPDPVPDPVSTEGQTGETAPSTIIDMIKTGAGSKYKVKIQDRGEGSESHE